MSAQPYTEHLRTWRDPGRRRPERGLGAVLRRVMREIKRERDPFARISKAWEAAAPDLAPRTRVVNYRHGTLTVATASAPHRAEFVAFRKQELIDAIRATPAGADLADIRFILVSSLSPNT